MSLLPGSQFDILQTADVSGLPTDRPFKGQHAQISQTPVLASSFQPQNSASSGSGVEVNLITSPQAEDTFEPSSRQPEVVLVVFLGGVTYSEISALRFISSQSSAGKYRYVMWHLSFFDLLDSVFFEHSCFSC
jgi:hypothetical protein